MDKEEKEGTVEAYIHYTSILFLYVIFSLSERSKLENEKEITEFYNEWESEGKDSKSIYSFTFYIFAL